MRSTPKAACTTDANIEELDRKQSQTTKAAEGYKCMAPKHPNRIVVDKWKTNNRLKLKNPVLIAKYKINSLKKEKNLTKVPDIPSNTHYTLP